MIIILASMKDTLDSLMHWHEKPQACVWLNKGDESDLEKARNYAKDKQITVYTYDDNERDPLGRAKRELVASRPPK